MALLELRDVHLACGGPELLAGVDLRLEAGERVSLIGRNGTGKTSLLELIAGQRPADAGERVVARGARIALLPQDVPAGLAGPVADVVAAGAPAQEAWQAELAVERLLARMQLDPAAETARLSAGQKRRVLLARALVGQPDLLLLDEPTNHLDIPSIAWLEGLLDRWQGALLLVTHDRALLRRLTRRIVELDRGQLVDWTCDFDTWLARKEALLATEQQQRREFDRKLAQEEAWLRQGIKARRTRNEGRVRRLQAMRQERAARRGREGEVRLEASAAPRSGRLVIRTRDLQVARGGRTLCRDLDLTVLRGDRVGIIGPNGAGKTTLLRTLLGDLPPSGGQVELGEGVAVAVFDQLRETLDPERSVRWNVAEGQEKVTVGGNPRHVISYLQDFLFSPARCDQPVRSLSGGERNRLLLARLLTRPANLLMLDEPTNDLDLETLELLADLLSEFAGTVLLVSHDRRFLDDVVTSTLVLDGQGGAAEYVGGYADWQRQSGGWDAIVAAEAGPRGADVRTGASGEQADARGGAATDPGVAAASPHRRLKWREQRELEALPGQIEELESRQAAIHAELADPGLYRDRASAVAGLQAELAAVTEQLDAAYQRWAELEDIAGSS